jgi:hypothetical protein
MKQVSALILLLSSFWLDSAQAACATPAGVAGQLSWSSPIVKFCDGTTWWDTSVTTKTTCTAGTAGTINYSGGEVLFCNGTNWISMKGLQRSTCAGTTAGTFRYNSSTTVYEFCDGTNWFTMYPQIGFFVRTAATTAGNLGGLTGANSTCLTELTNNTWLGKNIAQANGKIASSTVRAFLCNGTTCQNPVVSSIYQFAVSNDITKGGSRFTSNASGQGPNNSTAWSGATYFGATVNIWTGRAAGSSTLWSTSSDTNHCTAWTSSGSGVNGSYGNSSRTDNKRWIENNTSCNSASYLICMVDP